MGIKGAVDTDLRLYASHSGKDRTGISSKAQLVLGTEMASNSAGRNNSERKGRKWVLGGPSCRCPSVARAKVGSGVEGQRPSATLPLGQWHCSTVSFPRLSHACYEPAVPLRGASAQLIMNSSHSSFAASGLGRDRIHDGSVNLVHISKVLCST